MRILMMAMLFAVMISGCGIDTEEVALNESQSQVSQVDLFWMVGNWDCTSGYFRSDLLGQVPYSLPASYEITHDPADGGMLRASYTEHVDPAVRHAPKSWSELWTIGVPDEDFDGDGVLDTAPAHVTVINTDGSVIDAPESRVSGPLIGGIFDGRAEMAAFTPSNTITLADGRVFSVSYIAFAHSKPDRFSSNWRIGDTRLQQQYLQQVCSRHIDAVAQ